MHNCLFIYCGGVKQGITSGFFSIAEHLLMECVDDCHLVHLFSCYIMFNIHNFSHEKTSSLMAQQIQTTLFTVKVISLTTG